MDDRPEIRKKWEEAIGRPGADNVFICELHFLPKEIIKYEEIPMPNGETCLIEKTYARLHRDAIPRTIGDVIIYFKINFFFICTCII